ncbi:SUKH-3 domain-containing protein [Chromobacterium violaceum]|uniref:SUKH-3 domain-containing protein n=1 Tax=Chromobacterium violaceum TaxID=536 RepID=UPI001E64C317|nr:SUKH-3 domain-containing protein [Chromobacterium violaceum]MCD0493619.1 SUKH-3 domain-containing protein [Chromobacterium violaceum]
MNYCFIPTVESVLIKNGWHPDRKVPIQNIILTWKNEGYNIFQEALDFIQNLDGITFKHPSKSGESEDESCFNSILATKGFDRLWAIEVYEPLIGKKLLPIGQGYSRHLTYLMSNDGAIYGGYDDFFCEIGSDICKAMENIICNKEFITINS